MGMELSEENYFSQEANVKYMSVSLFKEFDGCLGRPGCEFKTMKSLAGEWEDEPSPAMLVGSYVDAYFDGSLSGFTMHHPEMFNKDGTLKYNFKIGDKVIERVTRDPYFMKYMSGEKQKIMTGEIGGVPWKIKMDSYIPGVAIVDLKVVKSIQEKKWIRDLGYVSFVEYWSYDLQGAVYQEIVRQNTGEKLPFYIAAASKESEPDIEIIQVEQWRMDAAITHIIAALPAILAVKNGEADPTMCGQCDCCKHFKVLKKPILLNEIVGVF